MSLIAIVAGVEATLDTSNLDKSTFKLVKAQLEHLISVVKKTSENTSANEVNGLKQQHMVELSEVKRQHEFALNKLKEQHVIALGKLKEEHEVVLSEAERHHKAVMNKKIQKLSRANYYLKQERDELRTDLDEINRTTNERLWRKRILTEEVKDERNKAVEQIIWSDSDANFTTGSVSEISSDTDESDDDREWWVSANEEKEDVKITMEDGKSECFVKICYNNKLRCMLDSKYHNLYCNWRGQCIEWIDDIAYWYGRVSKNRGKISIDRNAYRAWNVAKGIREMKETGIAVTEY